MELLASCITEDSWPASVLMCSWTGWPPTWLELPESYVSGRLLTVKAMELLCCKKDELWGSSIELIGYIVYSEISFDKPGLAARLSPQAGRANSSKACDPGLKWDPNMSILWIWFMKGDADEDWGLSWQVLGETLKLFSWLGWQQRIILPREN